MAAPLWRLCRAGDLDGVREALGRGENVNVRNNKGSTGLMLAVWRGHSEIVEKLLLLPDIDVNIQDREGNTALHFCAGSDRAAYLELLVAHRGLQTLNMKNAEGHTPLMRAVAWGKEGCARLLMKLPDIDLDTKNPRGKSLTEVAKAAGFHHLVIVLEEMKMAELYMDGAEDEVGPGGGVGGGEGAIGGGHNCHSHCDVSLWFGRRPVARAPIPEPAPPAPPAPTAPECPVTYPPQCNLPPGVFRGDGATNQDLPVRQRAPAV